MAGNQATDWTWWLSLTPEQQNQELLLYNQQQAFLAQQFQTYNNNYGGHAAANFQSQNAVYPVQQQHQQHQNHQFTTPMVSAYANTSQIMAPQPVTPVGYGGGGGWNTAGYGYAQPAAPPLSPPLSAASNRSDAEHKKKRAKRQQQPQQSFMPTPPLSPAPLSRAGSIAGSPPPSPATVASTPSRSSSTSPAPLPVPCPDCIGRRFKDTGALSRHKKYCKRDAVKGKGHPAAMT